MSLYEAIKKITFLSELVTGGGWRGFPYKIVPPAISPSVECAVPTTETVREALTLLTAYSFSLAGKPA